MGHYRFQGQPGLQARQGGAEAEVQAEAKTEMAHRVSQDLEPVAIGELSIVAVRTGDHWSDVGALWNGNARDLGIAGRSAEQDLDGRIEAQGLFDESVHSGGILQEQRQLVRMIVECVDAVSDQVGRGLVSGNQQQHDELDRLGIGQGMALAGIDEQTDQVLPRRRAAFANRLAQKQHQLRHRIEYAQLHGVVASGARDARDDRIAPALEVAPTALLDSQELHDHAGREWNCEVSNRIEVASRLELVSDLIDDDLPNPRLPGGDLLGCKASIHDGSKLTVSRRVERDDAPRLAKAEEAATHPPQKAHHVDDVTRFEVEIPPFCEDRFHSAR